MTTALLALLLLQGAGRDNPDYKAWKDLKPGSWIRLKITFPSNPDAGEQETTLRLIQVQPDRAVLERSTRTSSPGGRTTTQGTLVEHIPAKIDRPDHTLREAEEEIEVGGKRLRAKLLELLQDQAGKKFNVKMWTSTDVPGGVLRMEVRPEGKETPELKLEALAWEIK